MVWQGGGEVGTGVRGAALKLFHMFQTDVVEWFYA